MNNIVQHHNEILFGEVLPPGTSVRVIGKTHPLKGGRIERCLEVGLTIEEMLQEALEDHQDMRTYPNFIVTIDGHPIEERNWRRVRAKPGTTVTFVPRMGNGGMRTLFGLAIAVGAMIVAGPLGEIIAGSAMGVSLGISAGVATGFVAGGIMSTGSISLDALFKNAGQRWLS
jgi:hypothetical protein